MEESIKQRVERKLKRIADKEGLTFHEVNKIYKSQFKFTKSVIESIPKEEMRVMPKEELEKLVFNYIYIGKLYTSEALQEWANKTKDNRNNKYNKNGSKED